MKFSASSRKKLIKTPEKTIDDAVVNNFIFPFPVTCENSHCCISQSLRVAATYDSFYMLSILVLCHIIDYWNSEYALQGSSLTPTLTPDDSFCLVSKLYEHSNS